MKHGGQPPGVDPGLREGGAWANIHELDSFPASLLKLEELIVLTKEVFKTDWALLDPTPRRSSSSEVLATWLREREPYPARSEDARTSGARRTRGIRGRIMMDVRRQMESAAGSLPT